MYLHFSKKDSIRDIIDNGKIIYNWNLNETDLNESKSLGEFKKINFFIGANNSGKSRFLRTLIKSQQLNDVLISNSDISFQKQIDQYYKYHSQIYSRIGGYTNINNILQSYRKLIKSDFYNFLISKNNFDNYLDLCSEITEKVNISVRNKSYKEIIFNLAKKTLELISVGLKIQKNCPNEKLYIPILRSLHENEYIREGQIKKTIKRNYDIEKGVFTGLEIHKKVHDLKTTGIVNRRKIKKFETFLSKNFFSDKEVEITGNIKSNQLLFSISGDEYPVHNLGDGIQSLILLLFSIYTADENDWFFIEEPETNLHPGLQRIFIETLLNDEYLNSKNLKYFFTTHSNHFLDTSIQSDNISIFQFEKKEDNSFFIKTNVKPEKEVLDILGVNTSSVFLSNTSIWVEGPTDRKYISKFLKLYCSHLDNQLLKEDIDFAFFEYGGNLIEHYLFDDENIDGEGESEFNKDEVKDKINSFALSNKIFLLADNDNAKKGSKKYLRRIELEKLAKQNKNFVYQNTELKEIENLLPQKIIKDFIPKILKTEESIKKASELNFSRDSYKNIGLGIFYEELFINNNIPKEDFRPFKADSGTLKNDYKIRLASFVVESDYTYDNLILENEELKNIIENLYKFITE